MVQGPLQHGQIGPANRADKPRIFFLHHTRQQERTEHRRQRKRHEQCAEEGKAIGDGHRREDLSRHPGHREQGNERYDDDGRGKENRLAHLARGAHNLLRHGETQTTIMAEMEEDTFHHHQRCVDDNAEIDRAE